MDTKPEGWERTRDWIAPLVLWRLVQLMFVPLALHLLPFNRPEFHAYFGADSGREPAMTDGFTSWDTQHYLDLARDGYVPGAMSSAFYPLWPLVIRLTTLGTAAMPVALLVANLLGIVGLLLIHRTMAMRRGADEADTALLFLLAAPGAFWLGLPYSEALFLAIVAGSWLALQSGRPLLAGVIAFFGPLTRPVGLFLALPLIWAAWEDRAQRPRLLAGALLPILGVALYFGVIQAQTGIATDGFQAQAQFIAQPSITRLFDPVGLWHGLLDVKSLHNKTSSALDRGMFLLFLALLPAMWKLDRRWFWYALPAGVIPALTSNYMSYTRYTLVVLPMWFALAAITAGPEHRKLRMVLLATLFGLQHLLLAAHATWSWAG